MVTVVAVKEVEKPVTLSEIKSEPLLNNFALVRQSRLSVVPVSQNEWNILLKMSNTSL
jgi:predicted RNA-binding protein with PUA-like domain